MILAVDIGNTHIILGCIDEQSGEVLRTTQLSTDLNKTGAEYAVTINSILSLLEIDSREFTGAIISSVVPIVTVVLVKAISVITGCTPLVLGAGIKTGLHIKLDDPGSIAGDLVATAVAAKEEYPLPAIIVDMGTATTITVVDAEGAYIGGSILPGAGLSLEALTKEASLLPRIEFEGPKKVIGTNTIDAMKGGIIFGSAGSVDGIVDRFVEELGGSVGSIIATGGLGRIIAPYCRHDFIIDNRLLMKGLCHIWNKNQNTRNNKKAHPRKGAPLQTY